MSRTAVQKRGKRPLTTAGWSTVFQEKIIREVAESGDPIRVAWENGVAVVQVMKCVRRAQFSLTRVFGADFLHDLDKTARASLLLSMEELAKFKNPTDAGKLGDLSRRLLEGTKTLEPKQAGSSNLTVNVQANDARVEIRHMTDKQLAERELELLREIKEEGDTVGGRAISGIVGDPSRENAEGEPREPIIHEIP